MRLIFCGFFFAAASTIWDYFVCSYTHSNWLWKGVFNLLFLCTEKSRPRKRLSLTPSNSNHSPILLCSDRRRRFISTLTTSILYMMTTLQLPSFLWFYFISRIFITLHYRLYKIKWLRSISRLLLLASPGQFSTTTKKEPPFFLRTIISFHLSSHSTEERRVAVGTSTQHRAGFCLAKKTA